MVFVPAPICCAKYAVFFCPKKGNCKSETPQKAASLEYENKKFHTKGSVVYESVLKLIFI